MLRFENIPVLPYTELLDNPFGGSFHRGGPLWPDWERQTAVRHRVRGRLVDAPPRLPADVELPLVHEPLCWCGAITLQFGHQIADFASRILAYEGTAGRLCFAVHPRTGIRRLEDCPAFFRAMLSWLRVESGRVFIVAEPLRAAELFCAPQQEAVGEAPAPGYLAQLSRCRPAPPPAQVRGACYVSRARQRSGCLAGERYVEQLLREQGVDVLHPETLPLTAQLERYQRAHRLILAEGSALHTLQLLGVVEAELTVLNRRPGSRLAVEALQARCRAVQYLDYGDNVHGLNRAGRPAPEKGITIPTAARLRAIFEQLRLDTGALDDAELAAAIREDCDSWLCRERDSARGSEASLRLIHSRLAALGYTAAC
jgi:hypothetical protein